MSVKVKLSGPIWRTGIGRQILQEALKETLEYGKGVIKAATPVRTGLLERSWYYRTAQKSIYNEVPYSPYVEEGTNRMEGRFMAKNSLPEIATYYGESISRQLDRLN